VHDDPTPRLVFPDTTVLINFALVDEMPLLGQLVANNGSWCGTVASECDDQASKQGLPHMRDAHDIFGEPLRLETPAEFVNFRLNQDFFRQASTNPDATHAGESETLAILTSRSIKSVVVSDDEGVPLRLANLDVSPTIQVTTSWHFFRVAYWKGHITETRLWEIRHILLDKKRGCPDEVRDRARFADWIKPPP
jgi:hypothetical protein